MKCCICKEEIQPDPISGWAGGNNPYPVRYGGRCCNNCNALYVLPERTGGIKAYNMNALTASDLHNIIKNSIDE